MIRSQIFFVFLHQSLSDLQNKYTGRFGENEVAHHTIFSVRSEDNENTPLSTIGIVIDRIFARIISFVCDERSMKAIQQKYFDRVTNISIQCLNMNYYELLRSILALKCKSKFLSSSLSRFGMYIQKIKSSRNDFRIETKNNLN